jgi:hypothetical protein
LRQGVQQQLNQKPLHTPVVQSVRTWGVAG